MSVDADSWQNTSFGFRYALQEAETKATESPERGQIFGVAD